MGNMTTPANSKDSDENNTFFDGDFSKVNFINLIWIIRPASQIIVESTIFLPVVLFAVVGNVVTIYILVKNPHIRSPSNLLIGNMAVADLASVLIHPWIFLSYDFFQNYPFGTFGCKTEGAVECSILIASVISVSAISYDRLTAIVLPQENRLTRNGSKIVIGATWVVGFLISIPLYFYRNYKERQWKNFLEKYCMENVLIINTYWYVIITVMVWIPLSVQLICYISIYIKLNKYEKVVLRKFDSRQVNYKKKAVRMMFAVILTFMICHIPFTAVIIYRHHRLISMTNNSVLNQVNTVYHTLWFVSKLLIFVNAALNPMIYVLTNEKFRSGFKTTKLSKWLVAPKKVVKSTIVSQRQNRQKSTETTTFKNNNIFFIFKWRPKSDNTEPKNTPKALKKEVAS